MSFLTILIVLGILQWRGSVAPVQQDHWFHLWTSAWSGKLAGSSPRLLATVGLPVLLVLLLQWQLGSVWFGLPALLLSVLVLMYSFGRGEFSALIDDYRQSWDDGDFEGAYEKALAIGDVAAREDIDGPQALHRALRQEVLVNSLQRWFSVILWFFVLGPWAALAYRLLYLHARAKAATNQDREQSLQVLLWLDWLPARLLALAFVVVGNFIGGIAALRAHVVAMTAPAQLLDDCALAALYDGQPQVEPAAGESLIELGRAQLDDVQAMISRSVVCWLVVLALLQLVVI